MSSDWVWPAEEIRRVGYRVVDQIAEHLSGLPEQPVFQGFPADEAGRMLASQPPQQGESVDAVLEAFARQIEPYPFGNGHPRYFAWVNSPPALMGIFAAALAAAMNPSCAGGNHAAIWVEREVIGWFRRIFSFPEESGGLLVSGGSMAALTALAVARHSKCAFDVRAKGLQGARLTFYKSPEGHGCYQKAVELLGVGSENLRMVETDAALRMMPAALDAALRRDREQGCTPVAVIASAGAVNTGAIDPLDEIAAVCARHGVWLHVDGAYGAPAILTEQYNSSLAPIARADSLALDPHKWLYVPVDAGLLLVRDADLMRAAFSLVPPYLRTNDLPWLSEYGFEQTRPFRALKVWMSMRHLGLNGYRRAIEHDIAMAERLHAAARAATDFEVREPQSLSIVCLRYAPPGLAGDDAAINRANEALLRRVQAEGKAFLSSTVIAGRFWLRVCIANPRTTETDVDALLEILRAAATSAPPSHLSQV
jgi:glutamate/tyrosine decarboxylase-like PLP-dependent enzyme